MNTAKKSHAANLEKNDHHNGSPTSVIERVHDELLRAIQSGSKITVLTGKTGRGKSSLLRAIGKTVSTENRLIFFNGVDFISRDSMKKSHASNKNSSFNKSIDNFNLVKSFIFESTKLGERLIIIVDAADCLPTDALNDLLDIYKQLKSTSNKINLILAGLPDFKNQLNKIVAIPTQNIVYCSMDELNAQDIEALAKQKKYTGEANNGGITFDYNALEKLSSYVNDDQKILDVLLDWCSAIAKEDKVKTITKDITKRAIAYAEQCSKDKHITIENAYPAYNNLQNYLSGKQSKNTSSANDEHISESTQSEHKKVGSFTTKITFEPKDDSNEMEPAKDEITPIQSILAPKTTWSSKNISIALVLATFALIIGLAMLVSQRLRSTSANVDNNVESISIKQQAKIENRDSNTVVGSISAAENDKRKLAEVTTLLNSSHQDENIEFNVGSITASENDKREIAEVTTLSNSPHQDENIEFNEDGKTKLIRPTADEIKNALLTESDEPQDVEEYTNASTATNPSATIDELEVDALHTIAIQQYEAKKLTTPSGDNAFETYQAILFEYPNNEAAKQGIQNIHDRYVRWANHDLIYNRQRRAKYFFIKAIEVNTNYQKIQKRLQNLETQLNPQALQPNAEIHVLESTTTHQENN